MQKFVSSAVSRLIELGSVADESRDIYEYGLHMLTSTVLNFMITIMLGFLFGVPTETLLMFISFMLLRSVSGGYHAKSFFSCLVVSAISMAVTITAVRIVTTEMMLPVVMVLSTISVVLIFIFAPVEHPNRPLGSAEKQKFWKLSRVIVIILVTISIFTFPIQIPRFGFSISLGHFLSSTATVVAVLSDARR